MGSEPAAPDGERKPDSRPAPQLEKPDGTSAAPAAPGGGLGGAVVRAKAVVGAAGAPAEQAADATADRVMRRLGERLPSAEPAVPVRPDAAPAVGVVPDSATPIGVPGPVDEVRRQAVTPPEPEPEPEPAPEPAAGEPVVTDQAQEYLMSTRGQGAPLPEPVRLDFETAFRRPLGDIRIHDDNAADQAARNLNALAFTLGTDIYFRSGSYDPSSPDGKRLLAHELAHVSQHQPTLGRAVVRRAEAPASSTSKTSAQIPADLAPAVAKKYRGPGGSIDVTTPDEPKIKINEVYVPDFKVDDHTGKRPLVWTPPEAKGDEHRREWVGKISEELAALVPDRAAKTKQKSEPPWYFERTKTVLTYGTAADIANALAVLPYAKVPEYPLRQYQIDHRQEEQLNGTDKIENLQLLDRSTNAASGTVIKNAIAGDLKKFLAAAATVLPAVPDLKALRKNGAVTFGTAKAGPNPRTESSSSVWDQKLTSKDFWTRAEAGGPNALDALIAMNKTSREKITGAKGRLTIATRRGGGKDGSQSVDEEGGTIPRPEHLFLRGAFQVLGGTYTAGDAPAIPGTEVGKLSILFFPSAKRGLGPVTDSFPIIGISGIEYGGLLDTGGLRSFDKSRMPVQLHHDALSPVDSLQADFDFESGMVGRARIPKPTIPLLENVEMAVLIDGADVGVEAVVSAGELKLPGPFQVTGGSLAIAATTGGIGVDGQVDFEVSKLAKGFISGRKEKSGDFGVLVGLDFDSEVFKPAEIRGSYSRDGWSLEGRIGVGAGKIPGIKRATADLKLGEDAISATGEFETDLKGVDKGTLGLVYDKEKGMAITGEILLGKGIPGIKGGKVSATVAQSPVGGWSLAGGITAEPDVPGLSGTVGGTYADGAFLAEADLAYERGLAKGTVKLGVTNRTLDQAGLPTGPPARDGALISYGEGVVTLAVTPWLQGTVGLKLSPKGQIEVTGKVAMPSQFTVFDERKVERTVMSVGIDLPIVGVAVAGQRIGIFATIKGGLSISAGFGPGQLRNVALEVTYSPDKPDQTTVKGTGTFAVPAHAGLRLQVDGGLGVGIPVVSATAGVSVHGEVGLAGEASAAAALNWTPATGIVLDARGEIFVEPKFRFGVDAFVDVTADLWLTEIELYHRTWKLAAFEYGSNLRFGLAFPLHYESGKPFALSFDQIQWTYPQINASDLLGGLMKQLVG
ncbi:eCIS core domain-containing protein [Paractinoplanes maris]|uniref:eCIS core domain-containing protein n=1 Tax=Paractinoplanes maris TaxID=1734446 RepID=UPI0020200523|nr:DUF4157 domain-containing protein [Actinoplanes maris]